MPSAVTNFVARWLLDRAGCDYHKEITEGRPDHLISFVVYPKREYRQAVSRRHSILHPICTVSRTTCRQYGFNPVIRDRCWNRRLNLIDAPQDLVWQLDPVSDCQRGFFHQRRGCRTIGDTQFVKAILGCRTTRRDDCCSKGSGSFLAIRLFYGRKDGLLKCRRIDLRNLDERSRKVSRNP
jgi:hypothetical protein